MRNKKHHFKIPFFPLAERNHPLIKTKQDLLNINLDQFCDFQPLFNSCR